MMGMSLSIFLNAASAASPSIPGITTSSSTAAGRSAWKRRNASSAFVTVNAAVAAILPVIVVTAIRLKIAPSKLLIPLCFGAHAGSQLALTGSNVNLLISDAALQYGGRPIGFFEFALAGIPLLIGTIAVVALLAVAACTAPGDEKSGGGAPGPGTLRVLASSELADMKPVLDRIHEDTGITVEPTYMGTLAAVDLLAKGGADRSYDALWLSSNDYLRLRPDAARRVVSETPVMSSPVAIGVKPATVTVEE